MKLLLLGPNGQLGTDLLHARETHAAGTTIDTMGRADVDVTDLDALRKALADRTFDALVNCTSYHKTDEVEGQTQRAFDTNAFAVRAMAEACAAKGARFVHISTDYVFDGKGDRPYNERDAAGPLNVYGASKLMGEALARTHCDDSLILRVASLFGVAGASGKGGNFVETMLRFGRERGHLRVVADQTMSPTATADVAWMIFAALGQSVPAGLYHAVNRGHATWHAFAARIIERAGVDAKVDPIPASEYPVPARRPAYSVLDNGHLARLIGDIPHWHDALDRYLVAKGHRAD